MISQEIGSLDGYWRMEPFGNHSPRLIIRFKFCEKNFQVGRTLLQGSLAGIFVLAECDSRSQTSLEARATISKSMRGRRRDPRPLFHHAAAAVAAAVIHRYYPRSLLSSVI